MYEIDDTKGPDEAPGKALSETAGPAAQQYPRIDQMMAARNLGRWLHLRTNGHIDYVYSAERCERFYLGSGGAENDPGQWEQDDWDALVSEDRKPLEQNMIRSMVNSAIGYQIANRMDISLLPLGLGANDEGASVLTRVMKQVMTNNAYHWKETEMFTDGMIRKRGYVDVRMSFRDNVFGEIKVTEVDPYDISPDDMASTYNPNDGWRDFTYSRWMTPDEIEVDYGVEARKLVESIDFSATDTMAGDDVASMKSRFGKSFHITTSAFYYDGEDGMRYYNVIERQYRAAIEMDVAVYPSGDIRPINMMPEDRINSLRAHGAIITKRRQMGIKWLASTANVVLYDDVSPYSLYTIAPFFPYFRRGQTRGMVDAAINPQEALNKALSTLQHMLNSVSTGGWVIEDQSLVNMTYDQAREEAAKHGVMFFYKQGTTPPKRLDAPQVPQGVLVLIERCISALQAVTGMDESLTAAGPVGEQSGVAYQARQYAAQQKLAVVLDNLAKTRHMVARLVLEMVQKFMSVPSILRITETDSLGNPVTSELPINQPAGESGDYMNDLTVGEYDLVIDEQPMQITFDNSQFEQVKALIEMGYPIPPAYALRYSNLADKKEIAKAVEDAASKADPLSEVELALKQAQTRKVDVETVNKAIEAIYGATQAGVQIAGVPGVASIADEVLQSAGFQDQNAAPIIPQDGAGLAGVAPQEPLPAAQQAAPPASTNPTTPANPGVGINEGIEAPGFQE